MRVILPLVRLLKQRITIKLVPHTGGRTRNFRFSIGSFVFVILLSAAVVASSLHIVPRLSQREAAIDQQAQRAAEAEANLESLLEEIDRVVELSRKLESSLQTTVDGLVYSSDGPWRREQREGEGLSRLLSEESLSSDTAVEKLNELSATLRAGAEPLRDVHQAIALQEELLRHIPNRWPVVAGRGHVTMEYGPNIHPILDQWYLHKGMDITDTPGVPVVASATGRVTKAEYDQFGYGWNVVVEHKYGFKTRYGHLQKILVQEGQQVESGERIGILGNTGTSTGPHVHFEVLLGEDVLDPAAFLKISNEFRRWRGNRS